MEFYNYELKIRQVDDNEEVLESLLTEYKQELQKYLLQMRTCMNTLDDDDYPEILLCCELIKTATEKLAKWEGYAEEARNECKRFGYLRCLDKYRSKYNNNEQ